MTDLLTKIREADAGETIEPATFIYQHFGPVMNHNYLCAVCRERSAVIEAWHGILQPCWDCQKRGFRVIKLTWFDRLLGREEEL